MIHFLKLIRYQNLLMLAFMQFIFRYGFLKFQSIPLALSDIQYILLVLSTVSIAAAGYIINNIYDQETDTDNKPDNVIVNVTISENKAYNYYIVLNSIGVGIGFYLSNVIFKPSFASLFILIAFTLYLYASNLKKSLILGNLLIALLLSISVILIGIFDLLAVTNSENKALMGILFRIILDYALFTFVLNFIREIVKDLEDVRGDYNQGMKTLPIVLGVKRTTKIVFAMSCISVIGISYYITTYLFSNNLIISTLYCIVFIVSPLIYFTIKIWEAKASNHFKHLSTVLKWILFFGILSILVINLNLK